MLLTVVSASFGSSDLPCDLTSFVSLYPQVSFYFLTDQTTFPNTYQGWKIIQLQRTTLRYLSYLDSRTIAKFPKLYPEYYVPSQSQFFLWVDANVQLSRSLIDSLILYCSSSDNSLPCLSTFNHRRRTKVIHEILYNIYTSKVSLISSLSLAFLPSIPSFRLRWCGFLLWNTAANDVSSFRKYWMHQILSLCIRDQIVLPSSAYYTRSYIGTLPDSLFNNISIVPHLRYPAFNVDIFTSSLSMLLLLLKKIYKNIFS